MGFRTQQFVLAHFWPVLAAFLARIRGNLHCSKKKTRALRGFNRTRFREGADGGFSIHFPSLVHRGRKAATPLVEFSMIACRFGLSAMVDLAS